MLSIDFYAHRSQLYPWNSVLKVLVTIVPLVLCLVANSIVFSVVTFVIMTIFTVGMGKTPGRVFGKMMAIPLVFALLSCIGILLNFGTPPVDAFSLHLFSRFYVFITKGSFWQSTILFIKTFGVVSCLFSLILSTPSDEIISLLRKVHVPQIVIELMTLIYRFIFLLLDMQQKMVHSSHARLGNHNFKAAIRSYSGIMINLFILAMRRSGAVFDTMEARGYDGSVMFYEAKKPFAKQQVLFVCGVLLVLLFCFFLIRLKGWK